MSLWQTWIGTALLGTDRQPPTPPQAKDALTSTLEQLNWDQPEQALLSAAGIIALHQQVGRQPATMTFPAIEPCPPDDLPICSTRTTQHLQIALAEHPKVLPELLGLIAMARQRVPDQWLPKLLEFGLQNAQLRTQIVAVLGRRGQWLAAQNPAWRYGQVQGKADFVPESTESQTIWSHGTRSDRALFLQRWREVDPAAAREALIAVWSSERVKEREALLEVMATRLSLADEPFLEKALNDRGQFVRELAVDLLIQLPASELSQRMAQRIQSFIQLQGEGEALTIQVILPTAYEKDWERDGVNSKPPKGQGQRTWWLQQMLASASLNVWAAAPEAIASAIQDHEWQDLLLKGWSQAAQHQNRVDWADALIAQFGLEPFDEVTFTELLALLAAERQEQLLQAHLPAHQADGKRLTHWLYQVSQSSQLRSLAFSRLVLKQLLRIIRNHKKNSYNLLYPVRNMALTLHPQLAPDVADAIAALPQDKSSRYWQSPLNEFLNRLSLRLAIHQAFEEEGSRRVGSRGIGNRE
ncbi:MAG: DUF5691 domain-containing protein [Leptolyngbyaceae cyanobacterium]